jgi:predicted dehydrogenase
MSSAARQFSAENATRKPRLGFAGLGWIGRNRMESVVQSGLAEVCALHDVTSAAATEGQKLAPNAVLFSAYDELLRDDLDGVVIATPNRFHAEQAIAALERGIPVFCQKPLGRNAFETRRIVEAARASDCLLGVDLSYRNMPAVKTLSDLVESGSLGNVFAVDAKFHNGYGPDKPWFYNYSLAGGGCLLDLGVHLIDLALAPLQYPRVTRIDGSLFSSGRHVKPGSQEIEDYAVATLEIANDTVINLSCSWNLNAGRDANIEISFYGTQGGATVRNVAGSFFDFVVERFAGRKTESLGSTWDSNLGWGGLATLEWVKKLASDETFDTRVERVVSVAEIIDAIYEHRGPHD